MTQLPELNPLADSRRRWLLMLWPAGIALLGVALLPLDLPIARWFHDGHCPSEILRWLNFFEVYAHGFGVACILLIVLALDPARRIRIPRAAAVAFGGGLLADLLKTLVFRSRPYKFDLAGTVGETFRQWLPLGEVASDYRSFPSGHMATAFGLTAALVWLYPRGRWLFPIFALLAGCQRMSSWSHFLSDVAWGASAGCFSAVLFLPGGLLGFQFDRLEALLASLDRRRHATRSASAMGTAEKARTRDAA